MYIRSFAKNIDAAIDTIKARLGEMLVCEILGGMITVGITVVLTIISIIFLLRSVIYGDIADVLFEDYTYTLFWIILIVLIWGIPLVTASYITQGGVMWIAHKNDNGIKVAAPQAIGKSLSKILSYLALATIKVFAWIPMIIVIMLIFKLLGISFGVNFLEGIISNFIFEKPIEMFILGLVFLILLSSVVIFIVLLYDTVFFYALPAIILGNEGIVEALKESILFIRGEFWKSVKKVLCFKLSVSGVGIGISAIIGTLFGVAALLGQFWDGVYMMLSILIVYLEWGIRMAYTLFAGTFNPSIIGKLYESQKCKVKGTDLRIKLQLLKQSQTSEEQMNESK